MNQTSRGLLLLSAGILLAAPASGAVYLNELTVRPAGVSELVELYNSGPIPVDLGGWKIQGNKGTYVIPPPTPIGVGGYLFLSVGDIQDERGGVTSLIDQLGLGGERTQQDAVYYGQLGSAPLPPQGTSLARAPDASAGPPPPPGPNTDGLVWTIDPTPTFGAINDAPVPQMGYPVLINEFDPGPAGGRDPVELYNPTPFSVSVSGWLLCNGSGLMSLNGTVPALGFLQILTAPGFDVEDVGLLYLFDLHGTRVDQLGFHDAPPLGDGDCYGRCPDGAPPYLGYNYVSSGGGISFLPLPCTLGATNGADCNSAVEPPGPPGTALGSWGRLKHRYR
jgi:hypothetical protein